MTLLVKDLGLAAFMQLNSCELLGYSNKRFKVEDPDKQDIEYWRVKYSNSCCSQHDKQILVLRDMVRSNANSQRG